MANERPVYQSTVFCDAATSLIQQTFDVRDFDGHSSFTGWAKPAVPDEFQLGLIVGPSGSGKSLLLREFGTEEYFIWDHQKAVISQFENPLDALQRCQAVGFNDVRSYLRPYQVLSTGEQFRVNLARRLKPGAVIDEFTSVVDRNVAKAASAALRRHVTKSHLTGIVLATCHSDVIEWLRPDWYFDTATGILHDGRLLQRPIITLSVYPCKRSVWPAFAPHHYLSHVLGSSARCFLVIAKFDGVENVVGFVSSLPLPSGSLKKAWREHRTVILPDFQGLGIGPAASDAIARLHKKEGKRYYSRTNHPRFGAYREKPGSGWMPTSSNNRKRGAASTKNTITEIQEINGFGGDMRMAFSHEYIGK